MKSSTRKAGIAPRLFVMKKKGYEMKRAGHRFSTTPTQTRETQRIFMLADIHFYAGVEWDICLNDGKGNSILTPDSDRKFRKRVISKKSYDKKSMETTRRFPSWPKYGSSMVPYVIRRAHNRFDDRERADS